MLTPLCRFKTLTDIFEGLKDRGDAAKRKQDRRPVLLMLGGGMAAGKSTVRKIIGQDNFWSKVGLLLPRLMPKLLLANPSQAGAGVNPPCAERFPA